MKEAQLGQGSPPASVGGVPTPSGRRSSGGASLLRFRPRWARVVVFAVAVVAVVGVVVLLVVVAGAVVLSASCLKMQKEEQDH